MLLFGHVMSAVRDGFNRRETEREPLVGATDPPRLVQNSEKTAVNPYRTNTQYKIKYILHTYDLRFNVQTT